MEVRWGMLRTMLLIWLLSAVPANAVVNGRVFAKYCERHEVTCISFVGAALDGYMIGIADAMVKLDAVKIGQEKQQLKDILGYCRPNEVTNEQVKDVVLHFIRNNPAKHHEPAINLTLEAVRQAFPCE